MEGEAKMLFVWTLLTLTSALSFILTLFFSVKTDVELRHVMAETIARAQYEQSIADDVLRLAFYNSSKT